MIKTLSILICSVFLNAASKPNRVTHRYEGKEYTCTYETLQGRIDGKYASYYANGQRKSEGQFQNNYRIGTWTLWDSLGKKLTVRNYQNPFSCIIEFPKLPTNPAIDLLNVPPYEITVNEKGIIKQFYVAERMVVWSKRLCRDIKPENNNILFNNNSLFNALSVGITTKEIKVYSTDNDQFKSQMTNTDFDTSKFKIVAYRIKEDSFFDNERLVMETRILGICPLVQYNQTNDTVPLCWLYYPHCRPFLTNKILTDEFPKKIRCFDELFFYRCFSSTICKVNYNAATVLNPESIEIEIIENEHELWRSFLAL